MTIYFTYGRAMVTHVNPKAQKKVAVQLSFELWIYSYSHWYQDKSKPKQCEAAQSAVSHCFGFMLDIL